MGIDQMGNDNRVVIKARCDGRMRLLWVEVIQDGDPFRRCAQLMREFRVSVCAVEANPNFNEAHRFARDFPGKVFVVSYKELSDELVNWSDRVIDKVSVRHTTDDARIPYTATVDQYRMMAWSFGKWSAHEIDTPDARTRTQRLPCARVPAPSPSVRTSSGRTCGTLLSSRSRSRDGRTSAAIGEP
jgi:hypothetical protein